MAWAQVAEVLSGLEGVKQRGDRRWYVNGRLVARREDDETLVVRCELDRRERLVDEHPETFSVTPRLEAHMKVLADLTRGDADVIARELRAAWELQRG